MTTRNDLRQQGEAMRARLFGTDMTNAQAEDAAAGFRDLLSETEFGIVWCRPGLALVDRMICTLAVLACVQRHSALRRYVGAALNIGLDASAIQEVLIQIGIYAGFTASEEALGTAAALFRERGIKIPAQAPRNDTRETLLARGSELLRTLHREGSDKGYAAPDNPLPARSTRQPSSTATAKSCRFRPGLAHRSRVQCRCELTALRLETRRGGSGRPR
jgi:4-carboxymuconolactone decarboxylase